MSEKNCGDGCLAAVEPTLRGKTYKKLQNTSHKVICLNYKDDFSDLAKKLVRPSYYGLVLFSAF